MSIKIGDRVLLRGIEGNIRDIQCSMASKWLDVTLERIDGIGKYEEFKFQCVAPEEITTFKVHATTEKQQYTGEWGGTAAMTISTGNKVIIRGIPGELLRIDFNAFGDCADVLLRHSYEFRGTRVFDEVEISGVKFDEIELVKEDKTEDNTMSNITVKQARIDHLMNTAKFEVTTVFGKCTVVAAQFENGFVLVESSGCVDPANYDKALGEKICKDAIREKLWQLEGYALQKGVHKLMQEM